MYTSVRDGASLDICCTAGTTRSIKRLWRCVPIGIQPAPMARKSTVQFGVFSPSSMECAVPAWPLIGKGSAVLDVSLTTPMLLRVQAPGFFQFLRRWGPYGHRSPVGRHVTYKAGSVSAAHRPQGGPSVHFPTAQFRCLDEELQEFRQFRLHFAVGGRTASPRTGNQDYATALQRSGCRCIACVQYRGEGKRVNQGPQHNRHAGCTRCKCGNTSGE